MLMHVKEELPLAVLLHTKTHRVDKMPVPVVGINAEVLPPVSYSMFRLEVTARELWSMFYNHSLLQIREKKRVMDGKQKVKG